MFTPLVNGRGVILGAGNDQQDVIAFNAYRFAELFPVLGPVAIGVTGQNRLQDLIGTQWVLEMRRDRTLRLYRREGYGWVRVTGGLPPVFASPLPEGARRVTMAFDQSARVVIAYELAGMVYLTRWDPSTNQYVQNVTISGHDPVVVFDATWSYDVADSDVLLFYLTPDREQVMARVQRELYATPHLIDDQGDVRVMDRVVRLPLQYMVLLSDEHGIPLVDEDGVRVALISHPYPYPHFERMVMSTTGPSSGAYDLMVIQTALAEAMVMSTTGPTGGDYIMPVIETTLAEGMEAGVTGTPTGGEYLSAVISHELAEAMEAGVVGTPSGGVYTLVVLQRALAEGMTVGVTGPTGGSYVTV